MGQIPSRYQGYARQNAITVKTTIRSYQSYPVGKPNKFLEIQQKNPGANF